jgi:hypothetical protein
MTRGRTTYRHSMRVFLAVTLLAIFPTLWAQSLSSPALTYPSSPEISKDGTAVLIEDYVSMPLSSLRQDEAYPHLIDYSDMLARVNVVRSEPANVPTAASRFFVVDGNGILYILDKATKKLTPYIDFGKVFAKFSTDPGLGSGVGTILFDPAYSKNGKFYTVHTENPALDGSTSPNNASLPGLNLTGYTTTAPMNAPVGKISYESILIEWTDTDIKNSTFEGTAREIMRVGFNFALHPMGDLLFNPLARAGSEDYGNLYITMGDGLAGETPGVTHNTPQRLDALNGKILRITPDINLRPKDMLSPNGRYRIPSTGPNANPFVSVPNAHGEIYAYGLRNPHRMNWDPVSNTLFADHIGNHSWESVIIVVKGANYGWAEREGPEQEFIKPGPTNGRTGSQSEPFVVFPSLDRLTVTGLDEPVTPTYRVAGYSHRDGDAIGSGYVYRGKLMPQLVGKYIFTDITTGRFFYTNLSEMLAAKGDRDKAAPIHEIQIMYKSPYDPSLKGPVARRMYDIVADAFKAKNGKSMPNTVMPSAAPMVGGFRGGTQRESKPDPYGVPYGGGRADVRLSMGVDGELYVLSKSDGMIRRIVAVTSAPPSKN